MSIPSSQRSLGGCSFVVSLLTTGLLANATQAITISSLGTLPSGTYSGGLAVNSSGQVTGETNNSSEFDPDNLGRAFRYVGTPGSGGAMQDLGRLGGNESVGRAINASGSVAGSSTFQPGTTLTRAFRYVGTPGAGGVMQNLGTLGGVTSDAFGINDSGVVSGSSLTSLNFGQTNSRAFRYVGTPGVDGVMENLGVVSGGFNSYGFGINASGQVTGYNTMPVPGPFDSIDHIFRSGPIGSTLMEDLGTLGGKTGIGLDINNAGRVVGYSTVSEFGATRAFRSGPNGSNVLVDLGTLGGADSRATAINNNGDVVGLAAKPDGNPDTPFLYLGTPGQGGEMIDLNAYLDAVNPVEGAKWLLRDVTDITDNGLITGTGLYEDEDRAFILNLGPTTWRPGDADRDRDVDFSDLLKLAQNYGLATGATWSQGNFTADGAINFSDLLLLAQNYGTTGLSEGELSTLGLDFAGDWALALSIVPEPATMTIVVASALLTVRRRVARVATAP